MSTTSSKKNSPKKSSGNSGATKKPKSTGFIETADFKPNWLETGPLSPDMLPESVGDEKTELTQDEYEALQSSLLRFYQEAGVTEEEANPIETGTDLTGEVDSPQPEASIITSVETPASQPVEEPVQEIKADIVPSDLAAAETVQPDLVEEPSKIPEPAEWVKTIVAVNTEIEPAETGYTTPPPPEIPLAPDPEEDEFIYDDFDVESQDGVTEEIEGDIEDLPQTVTETVAPIAAPVKPRKVKQPKVKKRRDRLSTALILTSLLLLAAAALVYFVNPFSRLALGAASLARPVSTPAIASPEIGSGEWCLSGDFLADDATGPRLIDSGAGGDLLAEDRIFSLEYVISRPGTYQWQVTDCADPDLAYPEAPAWVTTSSADQAVTFNFDSNERSDPLFFPIPFVVSADDGADDFRVLGNFQDWNPDDQTGQLQRINLGLYQQVRRIARAGDYEAYIIAGEPDQAIDAYGRTTAPIPFSFQTDRNGDYVVFLIDTDRGRSSVMYDMPPLLTSLAYGNGNWILSLALGGLALLILLGLLLRMMLLNNKRLQLESGCPNCGHQELMRISRRSGDRLLHVFGIPAYRYRCRHCTWEGTRLSESGASVSSGVALAQIDDYR